MSRYTDRQLARKLRPDTTPEPPAGLLEALRRQIPEEIKAPAPPAAPPRGNLLPFLRPVPRRMFLAAASLVMLLGGGTLSWLALRHRVGIEAMAAPAADRVAFSRTPAEERRGSDEATLSRDRSARGDVGMAPSAAAPVSVPTSPVLVAPQHAGALAAAEADQGAPRAQAMEVASAPEPTVVRRETGLEAGVAGGLASTNAVGGGGIALTARDNNGAPLPGATVEVSGPGGTRVQVTDSRGQVRVTDLPAGEYEVKTELEGFADKDSRVQVAEQRLAKVEAKLAEAPEDVITVTAETPLLDERRVATSAGSPAAKRAPAPIGRDQEQQLQALGYAVPAAPAPAVAAAAAPKPDDWRGSGRYGQTGEAPAPPRVAQATQPPPPPAARPALEPTAASRPAEPGRQLPPSTGGTAEPNDQPYGDAFFTSYGVNPFVDTEDDHLSTFALDVDTGSYNVVRRYLGDGNLPPAEAVRVEELVNAFDYGDAAPKSGDFAITAEGAPDPWAPGDRYVLARFAIKAREIQRAQRRPADLVFVVDVSGSMAAENRLDLVKRSLRLLLPALSAGDRVGLVTFGSDARVVLPVTADKGAAAAAIERLAPEGATNTEQGLAVAFDLIGRQGRGNAIRRVILCSDGVANVGSTGPESILASVGSAARRGIELTTVGFGMGNYNDTLMEQLADRGNGRYAYVDQLAEARRIFVESLTGTLETVAAEARAQVELDPRFVSRWRLLGYENRDVADQRFRDDSLDAGEIGAGHAVTALYELKLRPQVPPGATLALVRLRWRPAGGGAFREQQQPLRRTDFAPRWEAASRGFKLATVVGRFAEVLRGSYWSRQGRGDDLGELARRAALVSEEWPRQQRVLELVRLIERARDLRGRAPK